ncbi:DUF2520 domain-containing protein [Thermomicrobium sp. 4228-Ro]|uniref:Rossmann-like and DUF2520 domain-containing protein n=1 Tax=Thermomicrobium sp. 4228-Ro TaxID=2993937 RepID=UPI0022492D5F|nr:DUF2520 domain-containing protein [Thermomicrobium sp. 4228-Ro]MCX2728018.1 DUF2520 domain-containing protein [Thermomicrobium sp. 4228-Ro]
MALLGAGGAATALGTALAVAGIVVAAVWSRRFERAQALAAQLPRAEAVADPQAAVDRGALVVLAVPDSAIAPLCSQLRWRAGQAVIHLAGAYGRELLEPAARAGAETGAFHPLQTFAGRTDPSAWRGVGVAIDADPPLAAELTWLARRLGAEPFALDPAQRPLYHAAAAIAANGFVALVGTAAELLARAAGFERAHAVRHLLPLLRGVLDNLEWLGLPQALTGPVARADRATLERHLQALAQAAPEQLALYRALARAMLPLARERAAADPERLAALEALAQWLAAGQHGEEVPR